MEEIFEQVLSELEPFYIVEQKFCEKFFDIDAKLMMTKVKIHVCLINAVFMNMLFNLNF